MVTIIDYKAGNSISIKNMLKKLGYESKITDDPETINNAEKLILPGVGHFDFGMNNLKSTGLIPILNKKVLEDKIPILGICLGLQLFAKNSEEGSENGLGWFDVKSERFKSLNTESIYKIPHMGWSDVQIKQNSKLFTDMHPNPRYYFVHSYHLVSSKPEDVIVTCKYGYEFAAALENNNIVGVQFHPEKSHKYGMKLLKNFIELY